MITYMNGIYTSDASISLWDVGFSRGYGIFEFLRTYQGKPFHLYDHYLRLQNSLKEALLPEALSFDELSIIISTLMKKNKLEDASIKIIVTGGVSHDGFTPADTPTVIVMAYPIVSFPKKFYEEGVVVTTFASKRFLPMSKHLHYSPAIMAFKKSVALDPFEVIYTDENKRILEGSTSNFFAFIKDRLVTPKQDVLTGITREVVLRLASDHFPIERRDIYFEEIPLFTECFVTASNKEVLPIKAINNHPLQVGPNTKKIMKLFYDYTKNESWPNLSELTFMNSTMKSCS